MDNAPFVNTTEAAKMPMYRLFADVSTKTPAQRLAAARRIKRLLEKHEGLRKRTGRLSNSSYVTVWSNGVLEAGAKAPYASYLNEGTIHIRARPYVENALSTVLGGDSIIHVES